MAENEKKEFWFEIPAGDGDEGLEDLHVYVGYRPKRERGRREKVFRKKRKDEE